MGAAHPGEEPCGRRNGPGTLRLGVLVLEGRRPVRQDRGEGREEV